MQPNCDRPDAQKSPNASPFADLLESLIRRTNTTPQMLEHIADIPKSNNKLADLPDNIYDSMMTVMHLCTGQIAELLLPSDANTLLVKMMEAEVGDGPLVTSILKGVKAASRGSVERRILKAVLCASFTVSQVARMLEEDGHDAVELSDPDAHPSLEKSPPDSRAAQKSPNPKTPAVTDVIVHPVVNRPSRFDLVAPSSRHRAKGDSSVDGRPKKRIRLSGGSRRDFAKGRSDWSVFLSSGSLPIRKSSRARCDDVKIKRLLSFIFRSDHCHILESGSVRVRRDGQFHPFPVIVRKMSTEHLWREYRVDAMEREGNTEKILGRTAFVNVVNTFTRPEWKRKGCMDYVLAALVYDNIENVARLVKRELSDDVLRKDFLAQLSAVEEFLKFSCVSHIDTDKDILHCTDISLLCNEGGEDDESFRSACEACLQPFQLLENIAKACPSPGVKPVIDSATKRFKLYLGHLHRVVLQERRTAEYFDRLRKGKPGTSAIIIMDHKKSFEPIRYREMSKECYEKHDISWHGSIVLYSHSGAADSEVNPQSTEDVGMTTMVLDHICRIGNTEDTWAVASILDAVLSRIRSELPSLSKVWLVTDIDKHYRNDILPVMAPFVSTAHGIRLEGFIHPETSRGKGLVDAHFSLAMMHVHRYVREIETDVRTPTDLLKALQYDGGVPNSTAELVETPRHGPNLECWRNALTAAGRQIAKLGRVSEVLYFPGPSKNYYARVYAYSGGKYTTYVFGKGFSRREDQIVQEEPEQASHSVFQSTGVDYSSNMGVEYDQRSESGEDVVPRGSAHNSSGRSGAVRPLGDPVPLLGSSDVSDGVFFEVDFRGVATDVVVLGRKALKSNFRRRCIRGRTMLDDTSAEFEADGTVEPGPSTIEPGGVRPCINGRDFVSCQGCGKVYRRVDSLKTHKEHCDGNPPNRQVINRAAHIAMDMVRNSETAFHTSSDKHPALAKLQVTDAVAVKYNLRKGWAVRPKIGGALGDNTTSMYLTEIEQCFHEGTTGKGSKMSAAQIRETLLAKYPTKYDIPMEYHITSATSRLHTGHTPRNNMEGGSGGPGTTRRRRGVHGAYGDTVRAIVLEYPDIMPREGRRKLLERLCIEEGNIPVDFPSEASIRSKVSALKAALKNN